MALDTKEEAATIPIDFAINFVEINISQMDKPCRIYKNLKSTIWMWRMWSNFWQFFWEIYAINLQYLKRVFWHQGKSTNFLKVCWQKHMFCMRREMIYSDKCKSTLLLKWKFFVFDTTISNTIKSELYTICFCLWAVSCNEKYCYR